MQTKEELLQALVQVLDETTMVAIMRDIDKTYDSEPVPQGLVGVQSAIQKERRVRRAGG